jgi:hypothetical protein
LGEFEPRANEERELEFLIVDRQGVENVVHGLEVEPRHGEGNMNLQETAANAQRRLENDITHFAKSVPGSGAAFFAGEIVFDQERTELIESGCVEEKQGMSRNLPGEDLVDAGGFRTKYVSQSSTHALNGKDFDGRSA